MKHLFIINPTAGKNTDPEALRKKINEAMSGSSDELEIYVTKAPLDATEKVRAEAEKGAPLRVYACGGDGTLNECVNGAASFENVSLTHYASGSGNDFLRMFGGDTALFTDLKALINGKAQPIDLINVCSRKSINICSLGFDARVGIDVHKYTQNPFISGTMGYVVSLLSHFIKGINRPLKIKLDGKEMMGEFALVCACNGRYYGGGFNPVPEAEPDDGLMDVLIVKKVSRLTFLKLIGKYAKGRYAELSKYISHYRCTEIAFESDEELGINVDGEAVFSKTPAFRMEPGAVNFIFPEGAAFLSSRNS
ncbi:MAG: diacylglycerol kinase family lipid kinase [Oscillospiraceae bacterium]|nr:diacylglycerol kinase family lipid kinase [Oscillospiraceae bacterium]